MKNFTFNLITLAFLSIILSNCSSEKIKIEKKMIGLQRPANCEDGCKVGELQLGEAVITKSEAEIENWFENYIFSAGYEVDTMWIKYTSS